MQKLTDYPALLMELHGAGVEFIIVGGFAAALRGCAIGTRGLEIVYSRTRENVTRLISAVARHGAYLVGPVPGLPFRPDVQTIEAHPDLTARTGLGAVTLLQRLPGGSTYGDLLPDCERMTVFGVDCRCLALKKLIEVKRAAGSREDLREAADLEAHLEESEGSPERSPSDLDRGGETCEPLSP